MKLGEKRGSGLKQKDLRLQAPGKAIGGEFLPLAV